MANRFEKAAEKAKKPAGGTLPEELTAGMEQSQEAGVETKQETPKAFEETVQESVPVAAAAAEPEKEEPKQQDAKTNDLAAIYEAKQQQEPEARTVRLQAVITPTLNEKLNRYVVERKIKSRNDLINFLLERYFEEVE